MTSWPAIKTDVRNAGANWVDKEVVVDNETGYLIPFEQDPATGFATQPEKFARDLAARISQLPWRYPQ